MDSTPTDTPVAPTEPAPAEVPSVLGKRDVSQLGISEAATEALKVIDSIFGSNASAADKQTAADVIGRLAVVGLDAAERAKAFEKQETEKKLADLHERLQALGHPDIDGVMARATERPENLDVIMHTIAPVRTAPPPEPVAPEPVAESQPPQPPAQQQQAPPAQHGRVDPAAFAHVQERIARYNQMTSTPPAVPMYQQQSMGLNAQVERAFSSRPVGVMASNTSSMTPMQQLAQRLLTHGSVSYTPATLTMIGGN